MEHRGRYHQRWVWEKDVRYEMKYTPSKWLKLWKQIFKK
jgi:hypothetical protein